MRFDILTSSLKVLLVARGWSYVENEGRLMSKFINVNHFKEPLEVFYPKSDKTADFPALLLLSLKIIIKVEPTLAKHRTIIELHVLIKNIANKYSTVKNEWILYEPKSKYENNEIPDIYIPLK